jgi:secondary thiamine-phosphate synthase enzyme
MVDVTSEVDGEVARAGLGEGMCHVFVPHTTCGVAVNENADPDVQRDILSQLRALAPREAQWQHAEGNSDAHLKAILTGPSVILPVAGGRLRLGRWQAVFLCEFDGPRERTLWVTVTSST